MGYGETLALYALLTLGIIAVPGTDMLFVMTNGLTGGRRAALAAVAGMVAGGIYHTAWGTLCTGLLLALPAPVYLALQVAGAAYLAWIGVTLLRRSLALRLKEAPPRRPWVAFRQGAMTCVINPKAYVFTLSVFPQFLSHRFGPVWAQAVTLGTITAGFQIAIYGGLGLLAAAGRERFLTRPGAAARAGQAGGAAFLLVAGATLLHAVA